MKTSELLMLAAAGGLLLWALKSRAGTGASGGRVADFVNQIANPSKPGDAAWGWQYFTNGVTIDPDGAYWKDGRVVWAPGLDASF